MFDFFNLGSSELRGQMLPRKLCAIVILSSDFIKSLVIPGERTMQASRSWRSRLEAILEPTSLSSSLHLNAYRYLIVNLRN